VRLDHLLSKEQLGSLRAFAVQVRSDRTCLLAAHGWNIEHRCSSEWFRPSTPRLRGGNGGGRPVGYVARCWVLRDRTTLPRWGGGDGFFRPSPMMTVCCRVWGFWPSVENYIVDASILEAALWAVSQKVSRQGVAFGWPVWRIHWSISRHLRVSHEFDRTHVISSF
jgi:hypothetical protein